MSEELYKKRKEKDIVEKINKYNSKVTNDLEFRPVYKSDFSIESLCNGDLCKGCGHCCRRYPCIFAPTDFLDITNLEYMRSILDTGLVVVTTSPSKYALILRPRGFADSKSISNISINNYFIGDKNPCVLLGKDGCMLPPEYRPTEGLLYYPVERNMHMILYDEVDYIREYEQYQEYLSKLFKEYREQKVDVKKIVNEENVKRLIRSMSEIKKEN